LLKYTEFSEIRIKSINNG